jgi:hypothetical protein
MYGVPGAVGKLEQQQLLHAVVIADMVGAEAASQQASEALRDAAEAEQGLSAAAVEALAGLSAWPACLLQLLLAAVRSSPCCSSSGSGLSGTAECQSRLQRLLLAVLGDLEAVWADTQLKELLLGLPLPAVQLLLSSDQLCVASEDTVLYTAQEYVSQIRETTSASAATTALVALQLLVRAPQLSVSATAACALPERSTSRLLHPYQRQLKALLSLKHLAAADQLVQLSKQIFDAPASWQLGPRQLRPLSDGVRLQWQLPVEQLKQACKDSFAQQRSIEFFSPECSPPLGGLAWQLRLTCAQHAGGTVVGLWVGPRNPPAGVFYSCRCSLQWDGVPQTLQGTPCPSVKFKGYRNYLQLEPMAAGGWDEAAWAAKGLPTSGEMLLQLHVHIAK